MEYHNLSRDELIAELNSLSGRVRELKALKDNKLRFDKGHQFITGKYQTIVENARDIISIFRPEDLEYLYVNAAVSRILGYSPEELLGTNALELIHPDDKAEAMRVYAEALKKGEGSKEYRYRKKDGSYIWLEGTGRLIYNENGTALVLLNCRDISKRKRAEEEVRYRLQLEKAIADTVSLLFVAPGIPDFQEILSKVGTALDTQRGYLCVFKEDGKKLNTFQEWCAPSTEAQFDYWQDVDIDSLGYFMETIFNGQAVMVDDVNELPAEAATEKEFFLAKDVCSSLMVPIYATDGSLVGLMGFDDTRTCRQWLKEDLQFLEMLAGIIIVYWERRQNNYQLQTARNELEIRVAERTAELKEANERLKMEIAERKQMTAEMARIDQLRVVGEIAANIAHEIRNPMTSVRGFLQIFKENMEHQEYQEYFDIMIEEMDRANSIITEFLALAKNKVADLKEQNLNSIIKNLFPLILADAAAQEKSLKMKLEDIPRLLLDEKEIRQLLFNLVRNGLEAMSAGGTVTISTFADNDDIVLAVQDEGTGIEAEILENIDTPFFSTKENGIGLGLAVCNSITERHNAVIEVKTGPEGSSFDVRFRKH